MNTDKIITEFQAITNKLSDYELERNLLFQKLKDLEKENNKEEDEEDKDDKYLFYSPLFGFIGGSKKLDRRILKIAIAVFIGPWVVAAIFFLGLFLV